MEKIAVIAGEGRLPFLLIEKIKKKGEFPIVFALDGITDKKLTRVVDSVEWIKLGELEKFLSFLKEKRISRLIFSGKIEKRFLLEGDTLDERTKKAIEGIKDRGDHSLLSSLSSIFQTEGIFLVSPYEYLNSYMVEPGVLTIRKPTCRETSDIEFGRNVAKSIANLDIGNVVVVKEGMVLAIESMEGTDEAIRRGGKLGRGGSVIVKVGRDDHQSRFDHPPVVGIRTCRICFSAGISVIAFESDKTILVDKESLIKECNLKDIALVAL